MPIEPAILDTAAAADYCGLRPSTLTLYRQELRGPAFVKTSGARSGRIRYRVRDLDEWIDRGASPHERIARPPQCPPGGFSRPSGSAVRGPNGKFTSGRHPGQ